MILGVSIEKEMDWRGIVQPFSNVYHYSTELLEPGRDLAIIDELVRLEKLIHSTAVRFKVGRTWGPTDQGVAASVTREIKDLTGTGSLTTNANMYRESAILVQWPLGRYGSKNRPQFLRKWYHTLVSHGFSTNGSDPQVAVGPPLSTVLPQITVLDPTIFSDGVELCSKNGRMPTGGHNVYDYLEHRQLGR